MRKRFLWPTNLIAILALLLAGCAPQAAPTPPPKATPPSATAAPAASPAAPTPTPQPAAPKPKYGGVLNRAENYEALHLDPHMSMRQAYALAGAYESLLRLSYENKAIPGLAKSWETSPDGLTWTFRLQQGVKFHNLPPANGREMTSEDVIFSLQRVKSPEPEFERKYFVESITKYEAPDKYTVKLSTAKPFAPLLMYLATGGFTGIVAPELAKERDGLRFRIIGTGPFMLEKWDRGISCRVKRNPDYWQKGSPYLDGVFEPVIPDKATQIAAFRAGKLDVLLEGTWKELEMLQRTDPSIKSEETVGRSASLRINVTRKPLSDVRVRQAMHLAIDRDRMSKLIFFGKAQPSGPVPPVFGELALQSDELRQLPGYRQPKDADIAEAKRLMAEAGYAKGFSFEIIAFRDNQDDLPFFKEELAKIGIDAKLQPVEYAEWKTRTLKAEFDVTNHRMTLRTEVDEYLSNFQTGQPMNQGRYSNPEVDKHIDRQREIVDVKERAKFVKELQKTLLKELPWIPTVQLSEYNIWKPYLKGWSGLYRILSYPWIRETWLDK